MQLCIEEGLSPFSLQHINDNFAVLLELSFAQLLDNALYYSYPALGVAVGAGSC
jgi:hypothetical protein